MRHLLRPLARPISGWRQACRYWTVRLSAASAVLMSAWTTLPADLREHLPYANHMAAALFVAIALCRLAAQEHRP